MQPTNSLSYPSPAFVIGVTGNMDPLGYLDDSSEPEPDSVKIIRERVFAILDWAIARGGFLDPKTGRFSPSAQPPANDAGTWHSCWKGLGLGENTPVILLSSLAPGIDTIVAEATMDYAAAHPERDISIRAPLPFSLDVYRDEKCSTFCDEKNNPARTRIAKTARINSVIERIQKQRDFLKDRDIFKVELDNDFENQFPVEFDELSAEQPGFPGKSRRNLRYRSAGEYIATVCHLLLAFYDPRDKKGAGDLFDSGTLAVVEAKRRGLSWELLAISNNFSWADNGPVLRSFIERAAPKTTEAFPAKLPVFEFLHTYDTQPRHDAPDHDRAWQMKGDLLTRSMIENQVAFTHRTQGIAADLEIYSALLGSSAVRGISEPEELLCKVRATLPGDAASYALDLQGLATIRRSSATTANELDDRRASLLRLLILLVGTAAFFLGAYEHWHPQNRIPGVSHDLPQAFLTRDKGNIFQSLFLAITVGALIYSGWRYHGYVLSRAENYRYDDRAVAEAIRVQFYWFLSGMSHSVAANYMQRQRTELDWIRNIISAMCFPYERWIHRFRRLKRDERIALLGCVHKQWVRGQYDFFRRSVEKCTSRQHFWHLFAWSLAAGGVIQVFSMFVTEVSPILLHFFEHHWRLIFAIHLFAGVALVWPEILVWLVKCLLSWSDALRKLAIQKEILSEQDEPPFASVRSWLSHANARRHHAEDRSHETQARVFESISRKMPKLHSPMRFCVWVFGRRVVWGFALIASAIVTALANSLPEFHPSLPDMHDWWIILSGALLIGGGLSLAWAERSFLAELIRQYASMQELFGAADRRLVALLSDLTKSTDGSAEYTRILGEIHSILYNLGCEALDENAEWLILHRARPLEPFMAG